MLELRPGCEHCDVDLPPDSQEAMICSFECTFCRTCVDTVLSNVCPNCGGGFAARPIRPTTAWIPGVSLESMPATSVRTNSAVDPVAHRALVMRVGIVQPDRR